MSNWRLAESAMSLFTLSYILLWTIALLCAPVAITLLYRSAYYARLHELNTERREGHLNLIGHEAPSFRAIDTSSGNIRGNSDWKGLRHVILALSTGCSVCRKLSDEIASLANEQSIGRSVVIVCIGSEGECVAATSSAHAFAALRLDPGNKSAQFFIERGLPLAIVVSEHGTVVDVLNPPSMKRVFEALYSDIAPVLSPGANIGSATIRL